MGWGEGHQKGWYCYQGKGKRGTAADAGSALGYKGRKVYSNVWKVLAIQTAFPIPSGEEEQTYGNVLHGKFSLWAVCWITLIRDNKTLAYV